MCEKHHYPDLPTSVGSNSTHAFTKTLRRRILVDSWVNYIRKCSCLKKKFDCPIINLFHIKIDLSRNDELTHFAWHLTVRWSPMYVLSVFEAVNQIRERSAWKLSVGDLSGVGDIEQGISHVIFTATKYVKITWKIIISTYITWEYLSDVCEDKIAWPSKDAVMSAHNLRRKNMYNKHVRYIKQRHQYQGGTM